MPRCRFRKCKAQVKDKKNRSRRCKLCISASSAIHVFLCHIHNKPKSIQINNYKFTLMNRSAPEIKNELGKDAISLISENLTIGANSKQNLVYYLSESETGLARLCVASELKEQQSKIYFEKGADYITSSFVHMKLQLFIRKYLDVLPLDHNPDNFQKGCVEDKENRLHFLKDSKRVYHDRDEPLFYLLTNCKSGNCFRGYGLEQFLGSLGSTIPVEREFFQTYQNAFMLHTGEKNKEKVNLEKMAA